MAKPNRKIQPVQKVLKKDTAAQLPGAQTGYNFLYVLLITAYFVVDLIKPSQIIDNMGFQWLCITVLNLLGDDSRRSQTVAYRIDQRDYIVIYIGHGHDTFGR